MSIALFIVVNFVAVDLYVFPQTHTFPFSSNAIVLFVPADIFTIFSSGNYSIYHHPSVEVVQLFEKYKIETLNTYDVGDITILFLPVGNLLITSTYEIFFLI